jgi:hypothetical protein
MEHTVNMENQGMIWKGMIMILFINISSRYEFGYGFEIESHGLGNFINFQKCIYIIWYNQK